MMASNVVSLTDNAANDIRLTGNGIMAGTINAGSQGDVTLEAGAGAITNLPSGMISGDKLTAHARDAMTLNTDGGNAGGDESQRRDRCDGRRTGSRCGRAGRQRSDHGDGGRSESRPRTWCR